MHEVLRIALEEQERARAIVAGLGPCPISLSRATTQLGLFVVDRRAGTFAIRISRHMTDERVIRDTARHELAHQAAWERNGHLGHGPHWRTWALYLGCEPVTCTRNAIDPEVVRARQRYVITCRRCGWSTTRERASKLVTRTRRYACGRCRGPLAVLLLAGSAP